MSAFGSEPWFAAMLLFSALSAWGQSPERPEPRDETGTLIRPSLVRVDGQPIDVETGHAAPMMRDWDGDGTLDLLVGQFGKGYLGVYPNSAESGPPELGERVWAKSQRSKLRVPTG